MANILVVEDEKNMKQIISVYIEKGGHICITADDAAFGWLCSLPAGAGNQQYAHYYADSKGCRRG